MNQLFPNIKYKKQFYKNIYIDINNKKLYKKMRNK